mmetsp:Transcript_17938/g.30515  ORF Transcript_17938/g.30515 Transcript_17938/m.30515 type:complete len:163 (+) Transcript_17938:1432-1920(+)
MDVIKVEFFSHLHAHRYQVVRNMFYPDEAVMSFIAGSMTTFNGRNPTFNVAFLDPKTMLPVEMDVYAFDLDNANRLNKPVWEKILSYVGDKFVDSMEPESFLNRASKVELIEDLANEERYLVFGHGLRSKQAIYQECDASCRRELYCYSTSATGQDYRVCKG